MSTGTAVAPERQLPTIGTRRQSAILTTLDFCGAGAPSGAASSATSRDSSTSTTAFTLYVSPAIRPGMKNEAVSASVKASDPQAVKAAQFRFAGVVIFQDDAASL